MQGHGNSRGLRRAAARRLTGALAALALLLSGPALAEEAAPREVVPLDQLLQLPTSAGATASIEKRGGDTKPEWQARFRTARADLREAEEALAATRLELEEVAGEGGQWQMTAPGLGSSATKASTDAPLDYQLSQALRRQREEVERTRHALLELETEANLAGVPAEWRALEDTSEEAVAAEN